MKKDVDALKKRAETLVDQINSLVDGHGDIDELSYYYYKIVERPPGRYAKRFCQCAAMSLVLFVALVVIASAISPVSVVSVLVIVMMLLLLGVFLYSAILGIFYGFRLLCSDGPMEIGYTENEIKFLENALNDVESIIAQIPARK